jgi:hypothetical protein
MVALQAVMAQLLGGDTIHHAVSINPSHVKRINEKNPMLRNASCIGADYSATRSAW